MDTTLRKVLIYCERLPPLKTRLFDHVINDTSHDIEKPVSSLSQDLWQLNLARCWIWGGGSACKCSSHHQVLFMIWSMSSVNKFSNSIHLPTKSQSSVAWYQATWAKYTTTKTIFFFSFIRKKISDHEIKSEANREISLWFKY